MGLMDMVTQAAESFGGDKAAVAGGTMQEIKSQGGIGSVFTAFQQNGLGGLVQQWAGGQTAPAQPEEVEQGLNGTGMIENIANRTGASSGVVKTILAALLPMIIHHFVQSGHVNEQGEQTGQPAPETGGMLQSILSRML